MLYQKVLYNKLSIFFTWSGLTPVRLSSLSVANFGAMGKSIGSVAPSAKSTILK